MNQINQSERRSLIKHVIDTFFGIVLALILVISNFLGVCTTKVLAATTPVVVNDDTSLINAINSASTDPVNPTVIQLGDNIVSSGNITISAGKYVELDLGGKTLQADCIYIYGRLTVKGQGVLTNLRTMFVNSGGELILSGGTIAYRNDDDCEIDIQDGGRFVMESGEVIGRVNIMRGAVFEMSGGTINDVSALGALYVSGTASITGGTITGGLGPVVNSTGVLIVSGGTISNSCYVIIVHDGGQVTQTGGTILCDIGTAYGGTFNYIGGVNNEHPAVNPSASSGVTPVSTPAQTTQDNSGEPALANNDNTSEKDYLDELTVSLEEAIKAGGPQTIYWNEGTALPGPVMKMLEENPEITIVFSYTYEGLDYVVTLPGKYVKYDPNVPWCGPLYLYGLYGKYGTATAPVATTTQAGERSYTVISGETLWGIAMRLGTTVDELVRLNNITNPDRISIGQIIRY